jgi:hypothetical protein
MDTLPGRLVNHDGWIARVGRCVDELQRTVRGCLKIIRWHESSDLLFEKVEARVAVREVQFAARRQHRCDNISPSLGIRQPADRPPRREDQIERARREFRGLVDSPFDEFGLRPGLLGEDSGDAQGYAREIQPGGHGAAPHEAERVAPDMALQMQDALSLDVAEFLGFDLLERVLAATEAVEHVITGRVARVNARALIPIPAIDVQRIDHGEVPIGGRQGHLYRSRACEPRKRPRQGWLCEHVCLFTPYIDDLMVDKVRRRCAT